MTIHHTLAVQKNQGRVLPMVFIDFEYKRERICRIVKGCIGIVVGQRKLLERLFMKV